MDGFIIRVSAYHGEPVTVGGIPTRAGYSHDTPVTKERIVNDPVNEVVRDKGNDSQQSDYDLLALVDDFEDEYGCKVTGFDDPPTMHDGATVFEFDVFEPAWPTMEEAKDVVDDLTERVIDWCEGYPAGR